MASLWREQQQQQQQHHQKHREPRSLRPSSPQPQRSHQLPQTRHIQHEAAASHNTRWMPRTAQRDTITNEKQAARCATRRISPAQSLSLSSSFAAAAAAPPPELLLPLFSFSFFFLFSFLAAAAAALASSARRSSSPTTPTPRLTAACHTSITTQPRIKSPSAHLSASFPFFFFAFSTGFSSPLSLQERKSQRMIGDAQT